MTEAAARSPRPMLITIFVVAILLIPSLAQTRPAAVAKNTKPQTSTETFKAIFEPVNYKEDVNLTDAFFTSADEGWISGEHGTMLHTSNGGDNWEAQLGGHANGSEHTIHSLRFLDAKHGWAIQDDPPRLLRTADGRNWEEVNAQFPPGVPVLDYTFTSPTHAILLGGNGDAFYASDDGGAHWKQITPCQLNAVVQGQAHSEFCKFIKLQMISESMGYAVAHWSSPEAPNADSMAFFKTEDAGEQWNAVVPALRDCCGPESWFNSADHGVVLFNNGKTYITSDGGKNWRSLLSGKIDLTSGGQSSPVRFADREVGWALGHSSKNRDAYRVSYTTDGGEHWQSSADIAFPGGVLTDLKFALPRRDRAYVIGPHGMVYRYRVVPVSYTAPKGLPGPLMPATQREEH